MFDKITLRLYNQKIIQKVILICRIRRLRKPVKQRKKIDPFSRRQCNENMNGERYESCN